MLFLHLIFFLESDIPEVSLFSINNGFTTEEGRIYQTPEGDQIREMLVYCDGQKPLRLQDGGTHEFMLLKKPE